MYEQKKFFKNNWVVNNFFFHYILVNFNDRAYGERQESAHVYDSSANVYVCANERPQ